MALPPILEEILSAVASLEGVELGVVRLFDRDRGELETVVSLGMPLAYIQRYEGCRSVSRLANWRSAAAVMAWLRTAAVDGG